MPIDPERLRQIEQFMERAERQQFDTRDFQIAKSLAQWYEQYMAELKKPHPSRARIEQLRDSLEEKLASLDARKDASERPRDAGAR